MRTTARIALALAIILATCSRGPAATHGPIVLVPIGPVQADLLAHLQRGLPALAGREVTIGAAIPLPEKAFDRARGQYLGSALLAELGRYDGGDADRVLGIIDADVYAPKLNFIFGQAMRPGRLAVVAIPRLRGRKVDRVQWYERVLKVTVHELGHTFGFPHCDEFQCVMHFARSAGDTDRQSARFCKRHRTM